MKNHLKGVTHKLDRPAKKVGRSWTSFLTDFFPTYLKHCKQQASLDEEQLNEVDQFLWKQTELPEWLVHVVSFIAEVGPSFTQATRE